RHTRFSRDWSSDVCSSDLLDPNAFTQDTPTLQRVGQAEDNVVGSIPWGYPGWLPIENVEGARWNQYVVVPPLKGPNGFAVQPLRSEERRVGEGRMAPVLPD